MIATITITQTGPTAPTTFSATPQSDAHDEWRLDEALAETFPASDSIAVNPIRVAASTIVNDVPDNIDD